MFPPPAIDHITTERETPTTLRLTCCQCGETERLEKTERDAKAFPGYIQFYREHSACKPTKETEN